MAHSDRNLIEVDMTSALQTVHELGKNMSAQRFALALERTIKDAGKREVKKLVKRYIPRDYAVKPKWVASKVQKEKVTGAGMAINCAVPIKGERGTLGGIFEASGGGYEAGRSNGKTAKKKTKHKMKLRAKVLKSKQSTLPGKIKRQGGNPPFRLPTGAVMTRTTKKNKPIARVVGRAVPQMVDKDFESKLERPITDYIVMRFKQQMERKN